MKISPVSQSAARRLVAVLVVLVASSSDSSQADLVTYSMVSVGNSGNSADTTGYGAVGYEYKIGQYDVTIGQYTAFLNAVAGTDPYGLYDTRMGTDQNIAGISRAGSSGSYTYSVMSNGGASANRPITYVSWFDAARFANWMANGQPTGTQSSATTENGAYDLGGAVSGNAPAKNATNPNTSVVPIYWIPTENEWYKAAYFQPAGSGGPSDSYWEYATGSDAAPGNTIGSSANQSNYFTGGVYATGGSSYSPTSNYLTDVGAFTGSAGYYGTYDQSGLVYQWNDLTGSASSVRGLRGGHWNDGPSFYLSSSSRSENTASSAGNNIGFRLAGTAVPEIDPAGMGSVLALVSGALGLLERRRVKVA